MERIKESRLTSIKVKLKKERKQRLDLIKDLALRGAFFLVGAGITMGIYSGLNYIKNNQIIILPEEPKLRLYEDKNEQNFDDLFKNYNPYRYFKKDYSPYLPKIDKKADI